MSEDETQYGIEDLVAQEWREAGCRSIWLAAYRAVSGAEAFAHSHVVDLPGARVTFIGGSLTYQAVEVVGSVLDRIEIRPQTREAPEGTYVLISVPFAVGEAEERRRGRARQSRRRRGSSRRSTAAG
jgi:hypothetical protein